MSVTGLIGFWGSGKTLKLAEMCRDRAREGYEVYTNFGYVGEVRPLLTVLDILYLCMELVEEVEDNGEPIRHVFLALDEVGALFPSRDFQNFPLVLNILWQQGRKLGLDVAWTTQDFELVDANVRRVTELVIRCRGLLAVPRKLSRNGRPHPILLVRAEYKGEGSPGKLSKPDRVEWRWFRFKTGKLYETFRIVSAAKDLLRAEIVKIEAGGRDAKRFNASL